MKYRISNTVIKYVIEYSGMCLRDDRQSQNLFDLCIFGQSMKEEKSLAFLKQVMNKK